MIAERRLLELGMELNVDEIWIYINAEKIQSQTSELGLPGRYLPRVELYRTEYLKDGKAVVLRVDPALQKISLEDEYIQMAEVSREEGYLGRIYQGLLKIPYGFITEIKMVTGVHEVPDSKQLRMFSG